MGRTLYTGKAKTLHSCDQPGLLVLDFRDDVTAFNGAKHAAPQGKGELNCQINTLIMEYLQHKGIATHFVRQLGPHTSLVQAASVLPIECIFRNRAAGSFMQKYGLRLGDELTHPVVEFCVKSDALGDPLITESAITALNLVTPLQLAQIRTTTTQVNSLLSDLFARCNYQLIDGKLEFGLLQQNGKLVLVDEFTPDSCRLWTSSGKRLDKDLFREDLGDLVEGYTKVYSSLCQVLEQQAEA